MESSYQEAPSWVRRGHTRKPNKLVIWLYSIFDLIQDFGPMFSSMFQWIGKAGSKTWSAIARSVMLLINLVLLIGIIYLSVGHSYQLLTYAGFSGVSAWVAVAVWETVFVYCSIVIDISYKKGHKSSLAAWIGFFMGFAFVTVSNYSGMANNPIGKTIGIATPILLLVMKKVLEYQFKPEEKQKKKSWFLSLLDWRKKFSNKVEMETSSNTENTLQLEVEKSSKLEDSITVETSKLEKGSTSNSMVETSNKLVVESTSNSEEPFKSKNSSNIVDVSRKVVEKKLVENMETSSQPNTSNKMEKLETSRKTKKPSRKVERKQKLEVEKSILEMKVENPKTPLEWAIYLHQRDGKLPGRPTLMEKSGCSDWIARKTLKELKQKIS